MDPVDDFDCIYTREDLAAFLDQLAIKVERRPQGIENLALSDFLEAAAAWVRDMDGYYLNARQPVPETPSWSVVGAIFDAALIYE